MSFLFLDEELFSPPNIVNGIEVNEFVFYGVTCGL